MPKTSWMMIAALALPGAAMSQTTLPSPVETLGEVAFDTSCDESSKAPFNRAVALMHSFQFGPAIAGFQSVLKNDPSCSIAYWGIALSSWGNPFTISRKTSEQLTQGQSAVDRGNAAPPKSARERLYLQAIGQLYTDTDSTTQAARLNRYEAAMAALVTEYPNDVEARTFYALALAAAADPADKTFANQKKGGKILEDLYAQHPNHPGLAHYIIHTYDVPPLAGRAADAARRYSQIAPSTPHALHMPSHTFTRLGQWQDSIDTNLASAASARAAGQPSDELHASDYMMYAYLQTAQDSAAAALVESAERVFSAYDPKQASPGASGPIPAYYAHAAIPARYCLERHAWIEALKLEHQPSPLPYADAITHFTIGLGAAHTGDGVRVRAAISTLVDLHAQLQADNEIYWAYQVDIERQDLNAQLAFSEGRRREALALIERAADAEDRTEKNAVTPGPLVPARELWADMLLSQHQPAAALAQYRRVLGKEPNRFWALYGAAKASQQMKQRAAAHEYFNRLAAMVERAGDSTRPEVSEARREAGV